MNMANEDSQKPSLPEYYDMLDKHDWLYSYSDDHAVWLAGQREHQKLADLSESCGLEYRKLFIAFGSYKLPQLAGVFKPDRPKED